MALNDKLQLHQAAAQLTAAVMARVGPAEIIDDPTLQAQALVTHFNTTWQIHMAFYYGLAGVIGAWPDPAPEPVKPKQPTGPTNPAKPPVAPVVPVTPPVAVQSLADALLGQIQQGK